MFIPFDEIKALVQTIIASSPQISDNYLGPKAGIYMLYVNDFSDQSVIPIYVGKTTNFKQRFKQHRRDVEEINCTSFRDYQTGFLRGAYGMRCPYEGHYKACKIFKYMIDHNCQGTDLQMLVLEACETENLDVREQAWIDKLRPAYVGFNQIDSITLQWALKDQPDQYKKLLLQEAELFRFYLDFGYSAFNYLHAFSNNRNNPFKDELDKRALEHIAGPFADKPPSELLSVFSSLFDTYKREYELARNIIEQRYAHTIHEIFDRCKLKSKAREREVLDIMTNSDPHNVIIETIETKEYLYYYMGRGRVSKLCGEQLDNFIRSQIAEIEIITKSMREAYIQWVEYRNSSLSSSKYGLLFPVIPFKENTITF